MYTVRNDERLGTLRIRFTITKAKENQTSISAFQFKLKNFESDTNDPAFHDDKKKI